MKSLALLLILAMAAQTTMSASIHYHYHGLFGSKRDDSPSSSASSPSSTTIKKHTECATKCFATHLLDSVAREACFNVCSKKFKNYQPKF